MPHKSMAVDNRGNSRSCFRDSNEFDALKFNTFTATIDAGITYDFMLATPLARALTASL
ncbi:hypothetical protein Rcae01_05905 [Novipirellula caenicola]|uniref:Uncharacterized protein n=1 Tax=Novipirellula caenicola TaxID=1536901 RepID=A0ABP9W2M7_9BACT